MHRRRIVEALICSVPMLVSAAISTPAAAHDLTLGVHYTSEDDKTDTVYVSLDGETFWGVSQPYRDLDKASEPAILYHDNHSCHMDPGITYWDGKFWMVSAEQRWDGRVWPIASYSEDLLTWTHPENDRLMAPGSTKGIALDRLPTVDGSPYRNFDVVTPKFAVIGDRLYLTFCAGYFGLFHGNQFHDQMSCYVAEVEDMSAETPTRRDGEWAWPERQHFVCREAHIVDATDHAGSDYIDSNLVEDIDGTVYLAVKQGGLTEQLFRCDGDDPADGSSYELANGHVSWGYEGVSINHANGVWHLYGDGVVGTKPRGMREVTSATLPGDGTWRDSSSEGSDPLHDVRFYDPAGNPVTAMHGQEITVTPDSPAYLVLRAALERTQPEVAAQLGDIERQEAEARDAAERAAADAAQQPTETDDQQETEPAAEADEDVQETSEQEAPVLANVTYVASTAGLTRDGGDVAGNVTFVVSVDDR